jgi:SAM-dependent methyltransferase|tara:strand:+ start:1613 stop:2797 length:1185 start_codon:yes stop_codon:yes gene_type:complete
MTSSEEDLESEKELENEFSLESDEESGSEFSLERVIPNDDKTKFLFQEHSLRYLFASQFVKSKTVLDAACGTGYGASMMLDAGAKKVVAIDNSAEAIEYCKKNYKKNNLEFKTEDCEKTNLDNIFDVVVSFEAIEHLKNQDSFISEVKRVLKNDGIFIVSTPNKETYPSGNPYHFNEFTELEFKTFLGKYFSNVTIFYQYYPPSMAICKPIDVMGDLKINFFDVEKFQIDSSNEEYNLNNSTGLFFIAICSNNTVENIDNKLYFFKETYDQSSSPEQHEQDHLQELRNLNKKKDANLKKFEKKAVSHMDQLRNLNKKKDANLTLLRELNKKKDTNLTLLRELNKKKDTNLKKLRELNLGKDADIENLRSIIKEMRESPSWKLAKKFGFLKKDDP